MVTQDLELYHPCISCDSLAPVLKPAIKPAEGNREKRWGEGGYFGAVLNVQCNRWQDFSWFSDKKHVENKRKWGLETPSKGFRKVRWKLFVLCGFS